MKAGVPQHFLILVGPTGVGKTETAFALAKRVAGEIVSADSRLFYRMMDVGTAKPDRGMLGQVPHHMIDVATPDEHVTCKRFEVEAREIVRDILGRGRLPIVVGGSGLYVRALTGGIFDGPGRSPAIRRRLEDEERSAGPGYLWRRLKEVDPDKAQAIEPANIVRVVRALEVYETTGRRMSDLEREARPIDIPFVKVGLARARPELYRMIDDRVERMLAGGLLAEVRRLVDAGYASSPVVRDTLGYREMLEHVEGRASLEAAAAEIKKNTRRFAKRQMTWFMRNREVRWLDITGTTDGGAVASEVLGAFPNILQTPAG